MLVSHDQLLGTPCTIHGILGPEYWSRLPFPTPRDLPKPRVPDCDSAETAERSYPASEVRGGGWEEIPHAPSRRPGAAGGRSYPTPLSLRPKAVAGRSNPTMEARGGGREDQPHVQGVVAARAQECLEELSHVECQEG